MNVGSLSSLFHTGGADAELVGLDGSVELGAGGCVFGFGSAGFYGSMGGKALKRSGSRASRPGRRRSPRAPAVSVETVSGRTTVWLAMRAIEGGVEAVALGAGDQGLVERGVGVGHPGVGPVLGSVSPAAR